MIARLFTLKINFKEKLELDVNTFVSIIIYQVVLTDRKVYRNNCSLHRHFVLQHINKCVFVFVY